MPNIFKKISQGASNVFKKVDSGATNFFKKTVPDIAGKANNALQTAGDKIAGAGKQVGNFLEKNAGVISDVVAGGLYATGFGVPLATAVLAGGNTLQQVGSRVKQGSQQAQQGLNTLGQLTQSQANSLSNKGQALQGQIKSQASQMASQASQQANQLKASAINSANNALANTVVV
jgi:hypothetical protein